MWLIVKCAHHHMILTFVAMKFISSTTNSYRLRERDQRSLLSSSSLTVLHQLMIRFLIFPPSRSISMIVSRLEIRERLATSPSVEL